MLKQNASDVGNLRENSEQKKAENLSIGPRAPIKERPKTPFSDCPRRYGETFVPTFCPHPECTHHERGTQQGAELSEWKWCRDGFYTPKIYPEGIQRFRCLHCNRSFSRRAFDLEFREHLIVSNAKIFSLWNVSVSKLEISRRLECGEKLVRGRCRKMAQQGMLAHVALSGDRKIEEPVAYDGLENFAGSQYDPNHINHAIGTQTLFCYDFNFAPLNRKGRMSERQKQVKSQIHEKLGAYPKRAIRDSTAEIIGRLNARKAAGRPLNLVMDEHFQYRRAIEIDLKLKSDEIQVTRVSSKETRNYQNLLFPINHADLLGRHRSAAFKRETIAFSKTHSAMVDKYVLFMLEKNYCRPQFVKKHVRRPNAHTNSPAMELGVTSHLLSFRELFDWRRSPKRYPLNKDWTLFYDGRVPYPREKLQSAAS